MIIKTPEQAVVEKLHNDNKVSSYLVFFLENSLYPNSGSTSATDLKGSIISRMLQVTSYLGNLDRKQLS